MTLSITRTRISQQDFRRIAGQSSQRKPILIIGPASSTSSLPVNTAKKCTSTTQVVEFCEHGPLVEASCDSLAHENQRAIIMRTATNGTPGAYVDITSDFADANAPIVVGDPNTLPEDDLMPGIEFVAGGDLAVAGIKYRYRTGCSLSSMSGTLALGTDTSIELPFGAGKYLLEPPLSARVALAVEIQANMLAHFNDAVAHNSADATAAALITLDPPTTDEEADAVINQCVLAWASHLQNDTAHDSKDLYNVVTAPVATNGQMCITRELELKADMNVHLAATYPADADALLAGTLSSVAVQTYASADLIAAGVTQGSRYPSLISFTTGASGTPADAPPDATISGNLLSTGLPDTDVVTISQIAGVAYATKLFAFDDDFLITYGAGNGAGATISIGLKAAAHNSADVTNVITEADPIRGAITAGDTIDAITSAPRWSVADIGAALDVVKLLPASFNYEGILLCGPVLSKAECDAIATKVEALRTKARWRRLMPHARMRDDGESLTDYADYYETTFGGVTQRSLHGAAVSWYVQSSHPNRFGQVDPRPFSFAYFARLCTLRPDINPTDETAPPNGFGSFERGYVRDPDNPSEILPRAVDDGHTELFTPLRAVAPRTKDQVSDSIVYPGQGAMFAPEGSDFYIAPYARIIDEACDLAFRPLEKRLGRKVQSAPDGTIESNERKRIEAGITQDLQPLVASGVAESITVLLDPDALVNTSPPVTVPVTIQVKVGSYIDEWIVDVSLQ